MSEKNSLKIQKEDLSQLKNGNRRLSLANLVTYQIEKKRSVQISGKPKRNRHLPRNSYIPELNSTQERNSRDLHVNLIVKKKFFLILKISDSRFN